jgi:hypothetical protein
MRKLSLLVASLCLAAAATPAHAYIGPGAGITMLGALWGVVVAVALALGAVLFWPIRVLLRRARRRPAAPAATATAASAPLPGDAAARTGQGS